MWQIVFAAMVVATSLTVSITLTVRIILKTFTLAVQDSTSALAQALVLIVKPVVNPDPIQQPEPTAQEMMLAEPDWTQGWEPPGPTTSMTSETP